jgi:hypothetical protein
LFISLLADFRERDSLVSVPLSASYPNADVAGIYGLTVHYVLVNQYIAELIALVSHRKQRARADQKTVAVVVLWLSPSSMVTNEWRPC